MNGTIRIVIIEDDVILLQLYKELIGAEDGLVVVDTYTSFESAEKSLIESRPDVILLDVQLPGMSGIEAIPIIKKHLPRAHVLILTVFESEQQIFDALANGASGYITKDFSSQRIIESIKDIKHGGGAMSSNVARKVISSFQRNQQSPLSKREIQVLEMLGEGKGRFQIANELHIDRETVKTHIKNVYIKLDVNSKADAIKIARESKWI